MTDDKWDHATQCVRELAAARAQRDQRRSQSPTRIDGRTVRWRVRSCAHCGGFYVRQELRTMVHDDD